MSNGRRFLPDQRSQEGDLHPWHDEYRPPSARAQIDELFGSDRTLTEVLEEVARLSVRLAMQTAVEAEVETVLGRARYERRGKDAAAGYRNGWQPPATVKTTMGPVELSRPKLRGTDEKFCSQLFG